MPVITPGVSAAARSTSRPFRGTSAIVFWSSTSAMLGSSVAIGAAAPDTVTFSVNWPTASSKSARTTWFTCTSKPLRTNVTKPGDVAVIV